MYELSKTMLLNRQVQRNCHPRKAKSRNKTMERSQRKKIRRHQKMRHRRRRMQTWRRVPWVCATCILVGRCAFVKAIKLGDFITLESASAEIPSPTKMSARRSQRRDTRWWRIRLFQSSEFARMMCALSRALAHRRRMIVFSARNLNLCLVTSSKAFVRLEILDTCYWIVKPFCVVFEIQMHTIRTHSTMIQCKDHVALETSPLVWHAKLTKRHKISARKKAMKKSKDANLPSRIKVTLPPMIIYLKDLLRM